MGMWTRLTGAYASLMEMNDAARDYKWSEKRRLQKQEAMVRVTEEERIGYERGLDLFKEESKAYEALVMKCEKDGRQVPLEAAVRKFIRAEERRVIFEESKIRVENAANVVAAVSEALKEAIRAYVDEVMAQREKSLRR
ncbi:hypothetical protein PENTCL1PPCAC_30749 [Pristionchus entomophagus]|uniref:Uncharacterized protein n=1 Tax=Pristionchus entomophagus TaxID=358040 RepID=A0AAV5T4S9_9BILA|nr:hypothetical protein PENTCL1PPCAC_10779 [Pristionchus entomophagus]GMT08575.1 hypothetical protein PENTCL1PPCAC_30749 [Pristionchus entomophagus]